MVSLLKREAEELGFIAIGFSKAQTPCFYDHFCDWVTEGKHGEMSWLARRMHLRENPKRLLEGCQTVISLAYPYSSKKPCTPDGYTAARYTEPDKADYHQRVKRLVQILAHRISESNSGHKTRVCIDSAPILERSFAYASRIGFIGKNNMLIIPGHGSYVFLAEILTTKPFPQADTAPMDSLCGSCNQCIKACPTGALEGPFSLNASRCLSYLTIEDTRTIDMETAEKMGDCFFGCDRCQEVCPFNPGTSPMTESLPSTERIMEMGERDFQAEFGKTAFGRTGLEKIKGNIQALKSIPSA